MKALGNAACRRSRGRPVARLPGNALAAPLLPIGLLSRPALRLLLGLARLLLALALLLQLFVGLQVLLGRLAQRLGGLVHSLVNDAGELREGPVHRSAHLLEIRGRHARNGAARRPRPTRSRRPARPAPASRPGGAPSHSRRRCPAGRSAAALGNLRASRRRTRGRVSAARAAGDSPWGLPQLSYGPRPPVPGLCGFMEQPLTRPRSQRIASKPPNRASLVSPPSYHDASSPLPNRTECAPPLSFRNRRSTEAEQRKNVNRRPAKPAQYRGAPVGRRTRAFLHEISEL